MKCLVLILAMLVSEMVIANSEVEAVNLPDGTSIENTVTTMDSIAQESRLLTSEELNYIQELSVKSKLFVSYYLPDIKSLELKDYDKAFRLWQLSETKKYTDDQVVELLGAYLGQRLVNDLDMEWVEITDEYGTDYAVRGNIKEVISFPFSTVFKRVEDSEYDFLYGVYHSIKAILSESDY